MLIELAFTDPSKVSEIKVFLNGVSVPVLRFRNPMIKTYETYYI